MIGKPKYEFEIALILGATLLTALAIMLAGCTASATYSSLAAIDATDGRLSEGFAKYNTEKELRLAKESPTWHDGRVRQVEWRLKADTIAASIEAVHAAVIAARDCARDVFAGIRSKAELSKFVAIATRTAAEAIAVLEKFGVKISGVNQ